MEWPDHEKRQVGKRLSGAFDEQVGVGHDLRAVVVPRLLPHGASVPAVVEAHDRVSGGVQLFDQVVVASVVLAQAVDDDDGRLRVFGRVGAPAQDETVGGLHGDSLHG